MDDQSTREIYEAERPQDAIKDYKEANARLQSRIEELETALGNLKDQVSGVLEIFGDDALIAAWRQARSVLEASHKGGE